MTPLKLKYITTRVAGLRQLFRRNLDVASAANSTASVVTTFATAADTTATTYAANKMIVSETDSESDASDFIEATPQPSKTTAARIFKRYAIHNVRIFRKIA